MTKVVRFSGPFLVAFCLGAAAQAIAEDPYPGTNYIAAGVLGVLPDSGRDADYGWGAAFIYGHSLYGRLGWEVRAAADILETGKPTFSDFYQYHLGASLMLPFGDPDRSHFFALGGVGGVRDDVVPDTQDGYNVYADVGLGWRSARWADWGIRTRIEARYAYDAFDDGHSDASLLLGFEMPQSWTRKPPAPKEAVKVVPVVKEVPVEVVKEVPVEVVKEVVREVPPPDSDSDGVPDAIDKCKDTLAGAKVEPDGCVHKEQVVALPNIEFEFGSAKLTANGKDRIEVVVGFMQNQPDVKLDVWGHTDWKGPGPANQKLSELRAAAVVEQLDRRGISRRRLASEGFGEMQPIADNRTDEGRARNRRVELHIHAAEGPFGGHP